MEKPQSAKQYHAHTLIRQNAGHSNSVEGQHCEASEIVICASLSEPITHIENKTYNEAVHKIILSPHELKKLTVHQPCKLRILDVTNDSEAAYRSSHIEGAGYMDITHAVSKFEPVPSPSMFQDYMRYLGINTDTNIIVYDQGEENAGYMSASRAWFLLRYHGHNNVQILDGGLAKWKEYGYATTSEILNVQKGNFTADVRKELLVSFDDMLKNLETNAFQVFDTRPQASYEAGHIAGAKSVPFSDKLINKQKKSLHSIDDIRNAFEEAGLKMSEPLIGMCKTGFSSCTALVALAMMGKPDVPLYSGSWREWEQKTLNSDIQLK